MGVEPRLSQLDVLLHGDGHDRRMRWPEVVIAVYFAADLLILFLKP